MDTKNYINTSNWNQLTMLPPDKAILREYDGLIGLTLLNIYSISKDLGKIRLLNFDRKNKEHLFVLRVALIARPLYSMPIEVDCGWWDRLCLNWKLRKGFDKVTKANEYAINGIWVNNLLDLMRPDGIARLGETFKFSDIYEAYYEGSLN